jgi:hypothetical protein
MTTTKLFGQENSRILDVDFPSPSCVSDFAWPPEGVELRGSINLIDRQVIDRVEVDAEWNRLTAKLQKLL